MKTIPCNYLIIQGRIVSSDAEGGRLFTFLETDAPLRHILLISRIKISASLTQRDCRYYALRQSCIHVDAHLRYGIQN